MSITTAISWCDSTVNATTGCEGCELWNGRAVRFCYAGGLHENRLAKSFPESYAANFQDVRLAPGRMMGAARWSDLNGRNRPGKPWLNGKPRMIFVGDMGDFCSKSVPDNYLVDEIFSAIGSVEGTRDFWLLLTKQIQRLAILSNKIGRLPDNCMAMTTVTDQHYADRRIPWLLKVDCKWRGISAEPVLGPMRFKTKWFTGMQWVVIDGESGDEKRRPMDIAWLVNLVAQCRAASVAVFVKQDGGPRAGMQGRIPDGLWLKEVF